MAKVNLIRTSEFPYHVTARCNNREYYPINLDEMWKIYSDCAWQIYKKFNAEIHAFTMMSNHYHMIISTPVDDLGVIMQCFQRKSAIMTNKLSGKINHLYGDKYHWTLIHSMDDFYRVLRYVYQNPVRAGCSKFVSDYPYSTFNQWLLNSNNEFPLSDRFMNRGSDDKNLSVIGPLVNWINIPLDFQSNQCISRGLGHNEFKLRRPRNANGLPPELMRSINITN